MSKVSLFVRMTAKPGKGEAVAQFLANAQSLVEAEAEAATASWFAVRFDSLASVPETGTLFLFGAGLLGLGALSRRRNVKRAV